MRRGLISDSGVKKGKIKCPTTGEGRGGRASEKEERKGTERYKNAHRLLY